MSETNLNARATQLALDAAYYEQKQNEAWDLVAQLSNWTDEQSFELVFVRGSSKDSSGLRFNRDGGPYTFTFTVSAKDSIGAEIFSKLFFYYRLKALAAAGYLNSLKGDETP